MQLKTDSRCRITSREVFRPNTSYEVETAPDGSIRLVELVPKRPEKAKLIRKNGRLMVDIGRPFDREALSRELDNLF